MTSTERKKTSNRPFDASQAKARERYGIDPRRVRVIGYDTTDGAEHPCWRADANEPPDENMIASIRKRGQIQPIRARKIDGSDDAMSYPAGHEKGYLCDVVVGRKRTKAARVVAEETPALLLDVVMFPTSCTWSEIAGTANAENYIRVTESLEAKIEHMHQQYVLEGADDSAIQAVAVDFGVSAGHVRQCLALRGSHEVLTSLRNGEIREGVALAIAPLSADQRVAELAAAKANPDATVDTVRERAARAKAVARAEKKTPASEKTSASAEAVAVPMSTGTLRRLGALCEREPSTLPVQLVAFLDVINGKQPPTTVEGLVEAMRAVGVL